MLRPLARLLVVAFMTVTFPSIGLTQTSSGTSLETEFLEPLPAAGTEAHVPLLSLEAMQSFALPGPLPAWGPRRVGDRIEMPVAGGIARVDPAGDVAPEIELRDPPPVDGPPEPEAPEFRVRTVRDRFLVAERRCRRCSRGWNRLWKLRVPGGPAAPPLITDSRIYFGARDNRVYCVKRRNGHRVWSTDIQGRVSRPIVRLDVADTPDDLSVLLVVPGDGSRIVALDPDRGLRITSYEFGEDQGRIVGAPVPLDSGRFVVARQDYAPEIASFRWFRLVPPPEPGSSGEMPYNGDPAPGLPPGS